MKYKKYLFFIIAVGLFFSFRIISGKEMDEIFIVILVILLTHLIEDRNLFHLMWMTGVYIFVFAPHLLLSYFGESEGDGAVLTVFVFLYSMVALFLTKDMKYVNLSHQVPSSKKQFLGCMVFTVVGSLLISPIVYMYMFCLVLILFARALRGNGFKTGLFLYLMVISSIVFYGVFLWSGFGRLILAGWVIVPTAVLFFHYQINFNKYAYLAGVALLGQAMTVLRFGNVGLSNVLESAKGDSGVSPYILASELWDGAERVLLNYQGMLDQFVLFFLGAFPRAFWPSKPNGFGFAYTVDALEEYLIEAGHSVAGLFIAEHFHYLGYWGLVTCLLAVVLFCFLARYLYSLDQRSGLYSIPLVTWVLTFFWGGMASFSTRFQISFAIVVVFLFFAKASKIKN